MASRGGYRILTKASRTVAVLSGDELDMFDGDVLVWVIDEAEAPAGVLLAHVLDDFEALYDLCEAGVRLGL